MKILALVEDLRVNKTSAGIRRSNILKVLLDQGHEIRCIYDYYDDEKFPWLSASKISFKRIKHLKDKLSVKILRKIPKSNILPSYTKGFNFNELNRIYSWEKAITLELKDTYDFILVLGAGNSNFNFFAISNIETKIPYVVNYHDPYPNHQYPEPYAKPSNHVGRLRAKASNKVIENAYKVSFPSKRLFEWMLNFHPLLEKKSFILPHVYTKLDNLPSAPLDSKVNLDKTKFNILHVGSLLGPRNPKFLIEAFNKFINEDAERKKYAVLSIIGSVTRENKNFDMNIKSSNINILKERISYKKSLELLEQSNVLLIIEALAENSPFMPGKLADYIAFKKYILALTPENSETSRLLGHDYKFKTALNNEDEIYKILVFLWAKWKENRNMSFVYEELSKYISAKEFNKKINFEIKNINA